jgi:hypothetical protein
MGMTSFPVFLCYPGANSFTTLKSCLRLFKQHLSLPPVIFETGNYVKNVPNHLRYRTVFARFSVV